MAIKKEKLTSGRWPIWRTNL